MTNNTYAINIWVKKILMKNDNNKVSTVSIIRVAIYKFKAEQTRTSKKKRGGIRLLGGVNTTC